MRIMRNSVVIVFIVTLIAFCGVFLLQKKQEDNTIPKITIENDFIKVSCNASDEELLKGVTATDEKAARVIVPDDKLSLAIGKDGQNARLAAKLTGWKIDVKSESKAMEEMAFENFDDIDNLENLGDIQDVEASEITE